MAEALAGFIASFYEGYAASQEESLGRQDAPLRGLPRRPVDLVRLAARFIVIVRHGLDVAESLADPRRHYPAIDAAVEEAGGDAAVGAGRFWSRQNRKILDFAAAHPEACHRITYEEVTNDPGVTLEPVFSFLGVPWDPAVLDYASVAHHAGVEDPEVSRMKQIVANSGKLQAWPAEIRAKVRAACEPELSELGYSRRLSPQDGPVNGELHHVARMARGSALLVSSGAVSYAGAFALAVLVARSLKEPFGSVG